MDLNNWSGPARRLFVACMTGVARKANFGSLSERTNRFRSDERGNFAMMTAILLVPLLLAGMVAMDATNLMRTRNNVQAALDAAALAVGKRFSTGASEADMQDYGSKVFNVNLTALSADRVAFAIKFPQTSNDNQQIEATANFQYTSLFGSIAAQLTNSADEWDNKQYAMSSFVRLKNTVEVALVLDNSGSMNDNGAGSNTQRLQLLKDAATQLVDTMAAQSALITRVEKPVQFSLVPFAGSVNIGPSYLKETWMDPSGTSPVNLENFTLPVKIDSTRSIVENPTGSGLYFKSGTGWGTDNNKAFSRAVLYADLAKRSSASWIPWAGCVEARPGTLALDVTPPSVGKPETLFVPMFGPAEYYDADKNGNPTNLTLNSWWTDDTSLTGLARQNDLKKYYLNNVLSKQSSGGGPNYSCTTTAITRLTDISTDAGKTTIKTAIKAMQPNGGTNVPEGMAWGWRTLVQGAPFTEGRPSTDRGNDKVVIVLTDGANTYYTYNSLAGSNRDKASNLSYYSAHGYTSRTTKGYSQTRLFQESGVSVSQDNSVYTKAMNARFNKLCNNAKDANIIVMTVAVDLNTSKTDEKAQIELLKTCSSDSRVRLDGGKPAKLFWNTTGGNLSETFRQIGDELSNLRISG
ncbi:pilus assembly protein TadG-related protein [Brucella sp. 22210]|uniref:TadE/TadG family type IV pilus assembly protein n=1 Tax=Brucella sp. 22210 TaxID=3453892 RepID=UPI003F84051B